MKSFVSLSFQIHMSALSTFKLFSSIRWTNCCSWFLSRSNKFLLQPIFPNHSRLLFHTPPCQSLTSLLEQIKKGLEKLSLRHMPPTHRSSHKLMSLPFLTSHLTLSSNFHNSFKSLHQIESDLYHFWIYKVWWIK